MSLDDKLREIVLNHTNGSSSDGQITTTKKIIRCKRKDLGGNSEILYERNLSSCYTCLYFSPL